MTSEPPVSYTVPTSAVTGVGVTVPDWAKRASDEPSVKTAPEKCATSPTAKV